MLKLKLNAVIGALVVAMMMGCGPLTEPEPGIMALELIGDGDDSAADGDQAGAGRHRRFIDLARQCAPGAPIQAIDACGRSVPGSEHLEWTNCSVELPEAARASQIVSSGTLDVSASLTGSCGDGSAVLSRTATFVIDRQLAEGVSMRVEGTSSLTRQSRGDQTVSIEVSRNVSRADASASGSVSGQLAVSVDAEGQRVLNGTISFSMTNPRVGSRSGTLTLENVARVSREECMWPVGGSMTTRTNGDQSKVIAFSETCGQATIDGAPVDLNEQRGASFGGRPGGRGGQRPF